MEQTPLVKTIQSLKPAEARDFRKFLQSPFFNHRTDVLQLFDYILSKTMEQKEVDAGSRAVKSPPDWSKSAAHDHLFFNEKSKKAATAPDFDDGAVRHVMSFLFLQLKNWLAYSEWAEDENDVNLAICRALKKRGLDPVFEKELKSSLRSLASTAERSTGFLFLEYQFALENWEYSRKNNRSGIETPSVMGDAFGAYVAATVLRQGCAALSRQAISSSAFELPFLEETVARIEKGGFAGSMLVQLYYRGFMALKKPDDLDNFRALSKLLNEQLSVLSQSEMHEIWMLALNFCIKKLNSGERSFMQEAFELYRTGLERRIMMEDGVLTKYTWKNVLKLGLAVGELDWCRQYLDDYKPFLPAKERESIWRLGLATWHFGVKDYDAVLDLLRNSEFRDPLANLDARRMILRIYYEKGETMALESLLDSFRIYMRRHRADTGYHRESFQNLVGFVRRLMKLEKNNFVEKQKLREEILATKFLAEREWLLGLV